ncbi:ubiquitin ligase E3 alpha, putative, partial [Entamoeba dispar SAW760]
MVENIIGTTLDSAIRSCQNLVHTRHCRSVGYGQKSLIYHCKTCSKNESACLCALCFNSSNHKGHDYSITEVSNFTCDCGDETQWKEEGFCPLHGKSFTGNLVSLLPAEYKGFPKKMKQCIKKYVFELIGDNITEVEKIGDIILKLMRVDLFYLIIAELLTKQFSPSSSILIEQFHQQQITYHEFLYEKMFTLSKLPTTLTRILTSFQTDLTLIHFDHEIIYKLFIYSLEYSQHLLNEVFCNTFIF